MGTSYHKLWLQCATVTRKIGMVSNEVSDMDTPTLHVAQNNISTRKLTH